MAGRRLIVGGLAAALGKDLRLLARDRVGLAFLTLAPIVVISVAGLSLAALYGDAPRGGVAPVLVLVLALPASAAEVRFDGSYRLRVNTDTNLALDDSAFSLGQSKWVEHRLRLTPKIVEIGPNSGIEIQASFDVLSGLIGGDTAADFRGYGFTGCETHNCGRC